MSMKNFVVIDAATGDVLRVGTAPEEMVEAQAHPGEDVLPAALDTPLRALYADPIAAVRLQLIAQGRNPGQVNAAVTLKALRNFK